MWTGVSTSGGYRKCLWGELKKSEEVDKHTSDGNWGSGVSPPEKNNLISSGGGNCCSPSSPPVSVLGLHSLPNIDRCLHPPCKSY